jgi:hypothetical protein
MKPEGRCGSESQGSSRVFRTGLFRGNADRQRHEAGALRDVLRRRSTIDVTYDAIRAARRGDDLNVS